MSWLIWPSGWHHRDIKPSNLYSYAGRFVVGDFGLIKRPTNEDLTRPQHVPGPYQYMPNEAVMRHPDIDHAAVDLFCLVKSLWVVLTESDRPPQGQIAAASFWSLSRRLPAEASIENLDVIVEQATSDDPAERGHIP
jgi:serine/threonine protein kinase